MQAYHKILVATDFSLGSEHAGRRGQLLAEQNDAELMLLHVVEGFPEDLPVEWVGPENVDPKTWITERAMQSLQAFAERLGITDAKWDVVFSDRGPRREMSGEGRGKTGVLIPRSSPLVLVLNTCSEDHYTLGHARSPQGRWAVS